MLQAPRACHHGRRHHGRSRLGGQTSCVSVLHRHSDFSCDCRARGHATHRLRSTLESRHPWSVSRGTGSNCFGTGDGFGVRRRNGAGNDGHQCCSNRLRAKYLERYEEDDSAHWTWSAALLAFRRTGNSAPANKALARAVKANRHVTAYLLGEKPLPPTLPGFFGVGDESEAVAYAHGAAGAWAAAPEAKGWVAGALAIAIREEDDPQDAEHDYEPDLDLIDQAVLALLVQGLHDERRAWKTFDWAALDRLHAKGLISNPVGRAKSVVFTEKGLEAALRSHRTLFAKTPPKSG